MYILYAYEFLCHLVMSSIGVGSNTYLKGLCSFQTVHLTIALHQNMHFVLNFSTRFNQEKPFKNRHEQSYAITHANKWNCALKKVGILVQFGQPRYMHQKYIYALWKGVWMTSAHFANYKLKSHEPIIWVAKCPLYIQVCDQILISL